MWVYEIEQAIEQLDKFLPSDCKKVIDVGSEGEEYRNTRQPWNKKFYEYLESRGMQIHTMELDAGTKPTFVHNIVDPVDAFGTFDLVIATHILEHIPLDRLSSAIENLEKLARGGYMLVSVPHKYPYHERPIDNMWRPTWQELKEKFKGKLLYGETFEVDHTLPQYKDDPKCQVSLILLKY